MDTVLFQPVYWFREKVVEPMRGEPQAWYHRKYPRVTGIEDCYTEDVVCRSEHDSSSEGCSDCLMFTGRRLTTSSRGTGWSRKKSFTS